MELTGARPQRIRVGGTDGADRSEDRAVAQRWSGLLEIGRRMDCTAAICTRQAGRLCLLAPLVLGSLSVLGFGSGKHVCDVVCTRREPLSSPLVHRRRSQLPTHHICWNDRRRCRPSAGRTHGPLCCADTRAGPRVLGGQAGRLGGHVTVRSSKSTWPGLPVTALRNTRPERVGGFASVPEMAQAVG